MAMQDLHRGGEMMASLRLESCRLMPSCMDFLPIANTAVHALRRLQEEARATTEDSHWHARRLSELPCRRCGATWFLQLLLSTLTHPDPDWYLIHDSYLGRFSTVVYDECMTSLLIAHAFQPPSSRSLSSDVRMLSRRTVCMCNYLHADCILVACSRAPQSMQK